MELNAVLVFLSLTALQIVLSIDNVIFISVLTQKLDPEKKKKARYIGVAASLFLNVLLISLARFLTSFEKTAIFTVGEHSFTIHNLILFIGGLFLIFKTAKEIRTKFDKPLDEDELIIGTSLKKTVFSMILIDLIFSIDSTITAIGMTEIKLFQFGSVIIAILFMFFFFNIINKITEKYPSLKVLALCFLFLIGFNLFAEGLGAEIPKGYTYFAMIFTLVVELINIKIDVLERKFRIYKKK